MLVGAMVGAAVRVGGTVGYGRVGLKVSCTTSCREGYGEGMAVGITVVGRTVGAGDVGLRVGGTVG